MPIAELLITFLSFHSDTNSRSNYTHSPHRNTTRKTQLPASDHRVQPIKNHVNLVVTNCAHRSSTSSRHNRATKASNDCITINMTPIQHLSAIPSLPLYFSQSRPYLLQLVLDLGRLLRRKTRSQDLLQRVSHRVRPLNNSVLTWQNKRP